MSSTSCSWEPWSDLCSTEVSEENQNQKTGWLTLTVWVQGHNSCYNRYYIYLHLYCDRTLNLSHRLRYVFYRLTVFCNTIRRRNKWWQNKTDYHEGRSLTLQLCLRDMWHCVECWQTPVLAEQPASSTLNSFCRHMTIHTSTLSQHVVIYHAGAVLGFSGLTENRRPEKGGPMKNNRCKSNDRKMQDH